MATKLDVMKEALAKQMKQVEEMKAKIAETEQNNIATHNAKINAQIIKLQEKIKELKSNRIKVEVKESGKTRVWGFDKRGEVKNLVKNHIDNMNESFKVQDIVNRIMSEGQYKGNNKALYSSVSSNVRQMCDQNMLQKDGFKYYKV